MLTGLLLALGVLALAWGAAAPALALGAGGGGGAVALAAGAEAEAGGEEAEGEASEGEASEGAAAPGAEGEAGASGGEAGEGVEVEAEGEGEAAASPGHSSLPGSRSVVALTGLRLASAPRAVLARGPVSASRIGFSFTASARAKVTVRLSRELHRSGHHRFARLAGGVVIAARRGRNSGRLRGHERLAAGTYRLTFVPAGGRARALILHVA
jgi:hypothetical protein